MQDAKGYGERVRRDFMQIVRKYSGQPEKIKEQFQNFTNHNQHKCTEICDHDKSYILLPYIQNVSKIASAKSSNAVESLHRMFSRECKILEKLAIKKIKDNWG